MRDDTQLTRRRRRRQLESELHGYTPHGHGSHERVAVVAEAVVAARVRAGTGMGFVPAHGFWWLSWRALGCALKALTPLTVCAQLRCVACSGTSMHVMHGWS